MKNILLNYWQLIKKYKFVFTTIIVLTFVAIGILVLQSREVEPLPSPTPSPLILRSVSPQPPEFKSVWSTEPIVFTFNKALDTETIRVTVSPSTEVNTKADSNIPNRFSVIPLRGWDANTEYTITISANTKARDGGVLASEIPIKIKRLFEPSDIYEIPDEHGDL